MSDEKIVPYLHPAEIEAIYGVRVSPRLCECDLMKEKLTLAVEALELVQSQAGIADAGEACRAIIKTARAALEKLRGEK